MSLCSFWFVGLIRARPGDRQDNSVSLGTSLTVVGSLRFVGFIRERNGRYVHALGVIEFIPVR